MATIVYSQTWDVALGGSDSFQASRVTSPVFEGAGAMRINTTATVGYWEDLTPSTDPQIIVAHFYLRFASFPATDSRIFHVEATNACELVYETASGQLTTRFDSSLEGGVGGPVLALGQWYEIDFGVDTSTPQTEIRAQVNGTALPTLTDPGNAVQGYSAYKLGWNDSAQTADCYWDELIVSQTYSDYPLGVDVVTAWWTA